MPSQYNDPYTPQSQLLSQLLFQQRTKPVYSLGAGLADVVGDVGSAFLEKKTADKQAAILAQAMQTASDPTLARDPSGTPGSNLGGSFTPNQPEAGQSAGPMNPGMSYGKMSLPSDLASPTPVSPNDRASMALAQLIKSPQMATQYGPQVMQLARQMTPPPANMLKLQAGETAIPLDPTTGLPMKDASGASPSLSGGPQQTETSKDLILAGYKEGTPSFQGAMQQRLAKDAPVTWRAMSAAEKQSAGIPTAVSAQVSSLGEVKSTPREPGQIGPAYSADTGQPMGVVDYTDPNVSPKLASGELLPHEPKVLSTADSQDLTKMGNVISELQTQRDSYKDGYGRTVGSTSKLRGFVGGPAYTQASEWFNRTKGVLLPTIRDTVGRSPQLIEEFNENRPEPTDADDVVRSKMNNLINIYRTESARKGQTYLAGGYLGSQVKQALGFDPRIPVESAAGAEVAPPVGGGAAPDAAVQALKADPTLSQQFDAKYGPGSSKRYLGR